MKEQLEREESIFTKLKKFIRGINPLSINDNIPTVSYVIKKVLAFLGIYIISMFVAEVAIIVVFFIMGYKLLNGEMVDMQTMMIMKYYGYVIFIIIAMLYCKFIEKRSLKSMGFNGKISGYLKGIIVAIILIGISISLISLTGQLSLDELVSNVDMPIIIAFLGGFIIQGAMEETLCRGFLMTSLSKRVSIPIAIAISTLAFAYFHLGGLFESQSLYVIIGIINLLLVSTLFSLYIIKDGNIWVACAIHSFWNFCLYNVCGLNLSGIQKPTAILSFTTGAENILNGGKYGIEASIITTAVLFVCVIALAIKVKKSGINKIEL